MSDFDKEAERERLREKYEAEQADREATQHMSELLLKGATMTNSHCGNCGDPIFRYDSQEFCPTCQNPTATGVDDATAAADDPAARSDDARPQGDAAVQGDAATPTNARSASADERTDARPDRQPLDGRGERDARDADASTPAAERAGTTTTPDGADGQPPASAPASGTNASVDADAVANVEATVERFAAAAANTDDPERAREYLAAVRDATDTLRALRGDAR